MPKGRVRKRKRYSQSTGPTGFPIIELAGRRRGAGVAPDALAVDVGEVSSPIRDWSNLAAIIPNPIETRIRRRLDSGRTQLVVLRYSRAQETGVLALRIYPGTPGGSPELRAIQSASTSMRVRLMRAGHDWAPLQANRAVVVGVGAVGSFVADLLTRSGIGQLILMDGDRVRPGNVVRHLAVDGDVGMKKVMAVKKRLLEYRLISDADIRTSASDLFLVEEAERLFEESNIVIDTTASATATNILALVAETKAESLISCSIMRMGALVRVDRWPLTGEEGHSPPVPSTSERTEWSREAGCGHPVSLTSPAAVTHAAILTARLAIDVLVGRPCPPTTIMVVEPQPDAPYDRAGFLL